MTRKELNLRESAVLKAYKDGKIDDAVNYEMALIDRNVEKKFYRFRPAKEHEIKALDKGEIFLCFPKVYEDSGDCEWLDDIIELTKYDVSIRNEKKYRTAKAYLTPDKYVEIEKNLRNNPKYIAMKEKERNSCLIGCITDVMSDYMWDEYAENSEGICLEYDCDDVFKAIADLEIRFFPVRYVDDRTKDKEILFGIAEYADSASPKKMHDKYLLSCMTKNKVPYSKESEWRVLCERPDIATTETGKLFKFIRPNKIYLGKNIKLDFKEQVEEIANKHKIQIEYA